jgi:hypothetical protein
VEKFKSKTRDEEMNDLLGYLNIRNQLKTGDSLGFQNVGIIPSLIRWKTADGNPIPLSHWGMIIRLTQYEQERRFTVEAESDGFQLRLLSNYIKDYGGHIYHYPLKDAWEPYRDQIGTDILSMIGTGYDLFGAIKSGFMKVSADARKVYCSEGCQIGYQNTAPKLCNDVGGRALVPAEMWKLGIFKSPMKIL